MHLFHSQVHGLLYLKQYLTCHVTTTHHIHILIQKYILLSHSHITITLCNFNLFNVMNVYKNYLKPLCSPSILLSFLTQSIIKTLDNWHQYLYITFIGLSNYFFTTSGIYLIKLLHNSILPPRLLIPVNCTPRFLA